MQVETPIDNVGPSIRGLGKDDDTAEQEFVAFDQLGPLTRNVINEKMCVSWSSHKTLGVIKQGWLANPLDPLIDHKMAEIAAQSECSDHRRNPRRFEVRAVKCDQRRILRPGWEEATGPSSRVLARAAKSLVCSMLFQSYVINLIEPNDIFQFARDGCVPLPAQLSWECKLVS